MKPKRCEKKRRGETKKVMNRKAGREINENGDR